MYLIRRVHCLLSRVAAFAAAIKIAVAVAIYKNISNQSQVKLPRWT